MIKRCFILFLSCILAIIQLSCISVFANDNKSDFYDAFENGMDNWSAKEEGYFSIVQSDGNKALKYKKKTFGTSGMSITAGKTIWQNYTARFDMELKECKTAGILFRYVNEKNHYLLKLYPMSGKVVLLKKTDGGIYQTVANAAASIKDKIQIEINAVGNNIEIYIDNEKILHAEDSSNPCGKIGFCGFEQSFEVNSVLVSADDVSADTPLCKKSDDMGLAKSYNAIYGKTVEERFFERVNELPQEIPVVEPTEVKGAVEYFVDIGGSDANNGTIDSPFATVKEALNAAMKNKDRKNGVVIYMRKGTYPMIGIGSDVYGEAETPIIISSYNNEEVKITGGTQIDGKAFKTVGDNRVLARLGNSVRKNVMVADLWEMGITNFPEPTTSRGAPAVYYNGMAMTLARWPNDGTVGMGEVLDIGPITSPSSPLGEREKDDGRGFEFKLRETRPFTWENTENIWMYGSFFAEWSKLNVRVKEFNAAQGSVRTFDSAFYGARMVADNKHYYFNILEELDQPGEWYYDKENGKLYIYPMDDNIENATINAVTDAGTLVWLSGTKNVRINGLIIEGTGGVGVRYYGCENTVIQNCIIRNIGSHGVYITADGKHNGITCSVIESTGKEAICIMEDDGDIGQSLIPQRHFVQNCYISNVKGTGIRVEGVGSIISHNFIQNTTNNGISVNRTNETIVEYNEITDTNYEVADGGAIYLTGYLESRGNHMRYNYIHDINARGIYLDDTSSDNYVYGNIVQGATMALFTHNGRENIFYENLVVDAKNSSINDGPNYYADNGSMAYQWINGTVNMGSQCAYMNKDYAIYINVYASPWSLRYPELVEFTDMVKTHQADRKKQGYTRNALEDWLRAPTRNCYRNNVVVNSPAIDISEIGKKTATGLDTNLAFSKNPGFYDAENRNYTLESNSEIYKKIPGFYVPEYDKCGIILTGSGWDKYLAVGDVYAYLPKNESHGEVNNEKVALKWNAVENVSYYEVTVSEDINFNNIVFRGKTEIPQAEIALEKTGKRYYWKVSANAIGKSLLNRSTESTVYSFTTMTENEKLLYVEPDTASLEINITKAEEFAKKIKEGSNVGEYAEGSINLINEAVLKARDVLENETSQQNIYAAANELKATLNLVRTKTDTVIFKPNNFEVSDWHPLYKGGINLSTNGDKELTMDVNRTSTVILEKENIPSKAVIAFSMKLEELKDWFAIGLRQTQKGNDTTAYNATDNYTICIKPDQIELQKYVNGAKYGSASMGIVKTVINESKIIGEGQWYDIIAEVISKENGVQITFKVNGETIIDYFDNDIPVYDEGYFSILANSANKKIFLREYQGEINLP